MYIRNILAASFLTAFACIAGFSQGTKVAVVDSGAFLDEQNGVTKLLAAYKTLEVKFKPKQDELVSINARIEQLAKDIQDLQTRVNTAPPAADTKAWIAAIAAKNDDGQKLQVEFKRKQEDAKALYEKDEAAATRPIYRELVAALNVFAKKNAYDLVFDFSKLGGSVFIINTATDITRAFILDFNSKVAAVPVK